MKSNSTDSSSYTLKELAVKSGVSFGTSGVRALVSALDKETVYAYTHAFIKAICPLTKKIAVAIDLRPSSPQIALNVVEAIQDQNIEAIYCGQLPTPALAYYAYKHNIPAIMVTGSHIPFDRNGIKFYKEMGEISKVDEESMLDSFVVTPNSPPLKSLLPSVDESALSLFRERYSSLLPQYIFNGKRIGVYEHSSAARDFITEILTHYGATTVSLGRTDTFIPIDTEAVSLEDKKKGIMWAKKYNLDAIVSTDGDGDRPLIGDENGNWLRGDIVGILCSKYLGATHVSTPVNSNSILEQHSRSLFTTRTKIGSPYVIAGMEELIQQYGNNIKVVGYEANGGFLVGSQIKLQNSILGALPTRDSILPILTTLATAFGNGNKLSEVTKGLPQRFTASDRIKDVPIEFCENLIFTLKSNSDKWRDLLSDRYSNLNIVKQNVVDGLRIEFDNSYIVHLRPSGNAPELRCYAETDNEKTSVLLVEEVLGKVKAMLETRV